MTLITAGNSSGGRMRCDARCHDAQKPKCECVCGGRYHGKGSGSVGLREAIEATEGQWIETLERQGAQAGEVRDILEEAKQRWIPGLGP